MPKPLWKNQTSELNPVFFFGSGVLILVVGKEDKTGECVSSEKEFFEIRGSPARKSTRTTVSEARGGADKVAKGCLKITSIDAPKGDPSLVSTTMRDAEESGAVFRHGYDTSRRCLWATPRQIVASWFAGQHSKPMSSISGMFTLNSQSLLSPGGSCRRGQSSNSDTPSNWSPEAHSVDGLRPGWASNRKDFFVSDLLLNCAAAVFKGVEAPKAGTTDSLGGRSLSARREVNARDQLGAEQRSLERVSPEVEHPMLKYSVGRGPHGLRPAACSGPLNDAAECKVKRGITVPASGWGALVPGGGMSVLASFAARGREHWLKDQTSARDHSGGRVRKARGRLAALGVPALEAVWHQRQEELCDRNVGGLWWGIDRF
jgi:hypothetical protein